MSIEIEVGLENAARVPKVVQNISLDVPPKVNSGRKLKRVLVAAGATAVILITALILHYYNRESTDDTQIDAHFKMLGVVF
jgi:hypothetical protein